MQSPIFPRPKPLIGDDSSALSRAQDPAGWAFAHEIQEHLHSVVGARRDIRRFRPEPVPRDLLMRVLEAGHAGPSVGHSQPWRFLVVEEAPTRERAAWLADRERLRQAEQLSEDRRARLLDLQLEGIREAPLGIVVACDRRVDARGVLGRNTFADADLWSCACAIENMWLTARAAGLGMGWVTLFEPSDLADLMGLPDGVETLGWLCLGWPDERPPGPGLERRAWSKKAPLESVVLWERWPDVDAPEPPVSGLRAPKPAAVIEPRDEADALLTPPGSLGLLDTYVNKCLAAGGARGSGTLLLVGADHQVVDHGVSAYARHVTADVLRAAVLEASAGTALAQASGCAVSVVDAGVEQPVEGAVPARPRDIRGDLVNSPAMSQRDVDDVRQQGRDHGRRLAVDGPILLGEVGVGNTTVAAALAAGMLHMDPALLVGQGAGGDADMVATKVDVVRRCLLRAQPASLTDGQLMAELGGPELAYLWGVVEGATDEHQIVVLDGFATSVAALLAVRERPAVADYLVAGHVSRESGHAHILRELGLEPLLNLRLRAGEGVGAILAWQMLATAISARAQIATTA